MMYNLANAGSWHGWSPWIPFGVGFGIVGGLLLAALFVAVIALKGYALWTAAKRDEKWWFIVMLVINTLGILELIYLYFVAKKWHGKVAPVSSVHQTNDSTSAQKP